MTERAPFKSSITDFKELRKRREELFPPASGSAEQPVQSDYDPGPTVNPSVPLADEYYGCYKMPESSLYDCYD